MTVVQQTILAMIKQTNLEHTRTDFIEQLLSEQRRLADARDKGGTKTSTSIEAALTPCNYITPIVCNRNGHTIELVCKHTIYG